MARPVRKFPPPPNSSRTVAATFFSFPTEPTKCCLFTFLPQTDHFQPYIWVKYCSNQHCFKSFFKYQQIKWRHQLLSILWQLKRKQTNKPVDLWVSRSGTGADVRVRNLCNRSSRRRRRSIDCPLQWTVDLCRECTVLTCPLSTHPKSNHILRQTQLYLRHLSSKEVHFCNFGGSVFHHQQWPSFVLKCV